MTTVLTTEGEMTKKPAAKTGADAHSRITVSEFISKHLDIQQSLGRTQKQIAQELGYKMPNMVSMLRRNEVKVPIPKVPALARALGVDPAFLMRLVMVQHWPEELEAINAIFGNIVTQNEATLIDIWRTVTKETDPAPPTGTKRALAALVS